MYEYNLLTCYNIKTKILGYQKEFLNRLTILKGDSTFLDAVHKSRHLGNSF